MILHPEKKLPVGIDAKCPSWLYPPGRAGMPVIIGRLLPQTQSHVAAPRPFSPCAHKAEKCPPPTFKNHLLTGGGQDAAHILCSAALPAHETRREQEPGWCLQLNGSLLRQCHTGLRDWSLQTSVPAPGPQPGLLSTSSKTLGSGPGTMV